MAIKTSKYPDGHMEMHLSKVSLPDEYSSKIMQWMSNCKDFLLYMGKPGCGKTYFCMAMKNLLLESKTNFVYVHEDDFLGSLKQTVSEGKNYEYDLEVYASQPFLIYDDLGFGKITEWQSEVLYKLIDDRVKSRLPTIMTSNLFLNDIKRVHGERIHSRLAAIRNVKIESAEEDLRQKYY